jgi:flagellar M-ring protein FliF
VRRISTAVLVDQSVRWDGFGAKAKRSFVPPSAEVLKGVHDVVAGVTGYSETRGDQITVETLPFENTLEAEPPPPLPVAARPAPSKFNLKQPQVIGGTALLVLLIAGLAFLLLRRRPTARAENLSPEAIAAAASRQSLADARTAADRKIEGQISENDALQAQLEAEALSRIKLPINTKKTEVLARHIRDSIHKDSTNATNVLRTWIAEGETKRTT